MSAKLKTRVSDEKPKAESIQRQEKKMKKARLIVRNLSFKVTEVSSAPFIELGDVISSLSQQRRKKVRPNSSFSL